MLRVFQKHPQNNGYSNIRGHKINYMCILYCNALSKFNPNIVELQVKQKPLDHLATVVGHYRHYGREHFNTCFWLQGL